MNTTPQHQIKNDVKELSRVLMTPQTPGEMQSFLEDFFSPTEVKHLAERWRICEELLKGNTHRDVKAKLGVSITKVSRCAQVLQYGLGSIAELARNRVGGAVKRRS